MTGKPADNAAYQIGSADDPQERAQAPDARPGGATPADAGDAAARDPRGAPDTGSSAMPGRSNAL